MFVMLEMVPVIATNHACILDLVSKVHCNLLLFASHA